MAKFDQNMTMFFAAREQLLDALKAYLRDAAALPQQPEQQQQQQEAKVVDAATLQPAVAAADFAAFVAANMQLKRVNAQLVEEVQRLRAEMTQLRQKGGRSAAASTAVRCDTNQGAAMDTTVVHIAAANKVEPRTKPGKRWKRRKSHHAA